MLVSVVVHVGFCVSFVVRIVVAIASYVFPCMCQLFQAPCLVAVNRLGCLSTYARCEQLIYPQSSPLRFVNLATNKPLVSDCSGSNRSVNGMDPCCHTTGLEQAGHLSEASSPLSSAALFTTADCCEHSLHAPMPTGTSCAVGSVSSSHCTTPSFWAVVRLQVL